MMRAVQAHPDPLPMRHFTCTLLAALMLSAPIAALAADKKESQIGAGKPTGKYLTRDELRFCLKQKDVVLAANADAGKESADLGAAQDSLAKSGDELKAALESLDKSSPDDVKAYNDRSEARDKAIDDLQARVTAFNARVVENQKVRDAYLAACQNRRYFDEDEQAIKKGK